MSQERGTESNRGHKHARYTSENHGTSCTYTELKAVEEVLKMSFTRHGCEASVFVRVCESVCLCVWFRLDPSGAKSVKLLEDRKAYLSERPSVK